MPSHLGPIKINSVSGGVVNVGDSFYLAPKNTSNSNSGAGSLNTGDFINTNNIWSSDAPRHSKKGRRSTSAKR